MQFLLFYLCCGLPLGLIEFISVLFIRDGGAVRLKAIYGLIAGGRVAFNLHGAVRA
ncbi:Uncharacterised protein [Raoultella ornithinolytica]|nr:Uncharacterised protein [Raoultella ornithinolytica]